MLLILMGRDMACGLWLYGGIESVAHDRNRKVGRAEVEEMLTSQVSIFWVAIFSASCLELWSPPSSWTGDQCILQMGTCLYFPAVIWKFELAGHPQPIYLVWREEGGSICLSKQFSITLFTLSQTQLEKDAIVLCVRITLEFSGYFMWFIPPLNVRNDPLYRTEPLIHLVESPQLHTPACWWREGFIPWQVRKLFSCFSGSWRRTGIFPCSDAGKLQDTKQQDVSVTDTVKRSESHRQTSSEDSPVPPFVGSQEASPYERWFELAGEASHPWLATASWYCLLQLALILPALQTHMYKYVFCVNERILKTHVLQGRGVGITLPDTKCVLWSAIQLHFNRSLAFDHEKQSLVCQHSADQYLPTWNVSWAFHQHQ